MKTYVINEAFYSLQGEGMRAGTANVFLRFTGCNLRCAQEAGPKSPGGFDCDTEFESGRRMTIDEIVEYVREVSNDRAQSIIFTGGEPALQVDDALIDALHDRGFYLAIETNGSVPVAKGAHLKGLDWITVSPKVAEHAIRQTTADEVKYVRTFGQDIPKTRVNATHYLISPAFNGDVVERRTLDWCIELVKQHPQWRLSLQQHKQWKVQ